MAKITKKELVEMIQEEIKRAQKIKVLKEEKARISKLLREMEEMDEMDTMEEYAETQPSDVPGAVDPKSVAKADDLVAKLAGNIDMSKITQSINEGMIDEGILDKIKDIFGKKKSIQSQAPELMKKSGISSTEDFKDKAKVEKMISSILEKLGLGGMISAPVVYGATAAALAKGFAAASIGGPITLGLLVVGLVLYTIAKMKQPVK